MPLSFSIFQEPWWLSAVTAGQYEEVSVERGNRLVGRLPFVLTRRGPFLTAAMPPFTHLLGPAIDPGAGKYQSRLARRLSIGRELISCLPSCAFFKQAVDPSVVDGLGLADGLAFQDCGFQVLPQYTFEIDCRTPLESIWNSMNTTVRQHIRRAEQTYHITTIDDPQHFQHFYVTNILNIQKKCRVDFTTFPQLLVECKNRSVGEILCASTSKGKIGAMVFIVWGYGVMYYLMSTRAADVTDTSAVSLLIWSVVQRCHALNLKLDLDGVYSSGSARFLSGFGGQAKIRMIVMRASPSYQLIQYARKFVLPDRSDSFT